MKPIDLGNGYLGKVAAVEPGLDSWMILDSRNQVVHTGYAASGKATDLMRAFLDTGTAALPEPPAVAEPESDWKWVPEAPAEPAEEADVKEEVAPEPEPEPVKPEPPKKPKLKIVKKAAAKPVVKPAAKAKARKR